MQHNYTVNFTGDRDTCWISYPIRLLYDAISPEPFKVSYDIKWGADSGIHYSTSIIGSVESFLPLPEYALRVGIVIDMLRMCKMIKYPSSLVIFRKSTGDYVDGVTEILTPQHTLEGAEKEKLLSNLLVDCINNGFSPSHLQTAKKQEIENGYVLLKGLYTGGSNE